MSLVGRALAVRNQGAPVPYAASVAGRTLPTGNTYTGSAEACLRAFGRVGTVWQIVHLLSSSVAKPEWQLFRTPKVDGRARYTTNDQGSDQRVRVLNHQALKVLNSPATYTDERGIPLPAWTRFGLMEISGVYLELLGKFMWIIDRDERSSIPLGMWPVRPDRMTPVPHRKNFVAGWWYTAPDGREKIPFLPSDVIYVRLPDPMNLLDGLGPVSSILPDIEGARSAAEWNANFFANGALPGGVIQVENSLEDDEFDQFVSRWRESHRGVARAHRVAVLEGGMTWVESRGTVKDMDFKNLRDEARDLIREAWGVHKIMLGNSDDVNRANAQTGEEVYANWSVVPRLDRVKDALNCQFLPLFGSTGDGVEFDYIYPLPQNREQDNAELTAKAAAALSLVQAGYDPADVADVVGLPRMNVASAPQQGAEPPKVPGGAQDAMRRAARFAAMAREPDALDRELEALLRDVAGRDMAAWNMAGTR